MTDTNWPNLRESDFIIRDFRFASGETLPELRQHYITLGMPKANASGGITPLSALMTQSVVRIQELAPTREKGDALYRQFVERAQKADANNRLYQIESTMDYDP